MKLYTVSLNGRNIEIMQDTDGKFIIPNELRGLGTALKPSYEAWWLVRKPIEEKTVAANVLKYSTGGINIDISRINNDKTRSVETSVTGTAKEEHYCNCMPHLPKRIQGVEQQAEKTQDTYLQQGMSFQVKDRKSESSLEERVPSSRRVPDNKSKQPGHTGTQTCNGNASGEKSNRGGSGASQKPHNLGQSDRESGTCIKCGRTRNKISHEEVPENRQVLADSISPTQGRFPANLVLSHNADCEYCVCSGETTDEECAPCSTNTKVKCTDGCAVAMLDEQTRDTRASKPSASGRNTKSSMFSEGSGEQFAQYTDSGGASRFFFNSKPDRMDGICQSQKLSNYAVTAANSLKADVQQAFTVLEAALKKVALEDKQLNSMITRFMNEMPSLLSSRDGTSIKTIPSIARKYLQELLPIDVSRNDLATNVVVLRLIDTMKIILNLLTLDFFVENVTLPIIPSNSELGEKDLNGNRFIYCAKASKSDKNAGCEELPEKKNGMMEDDNYAIKTGSGNLSDTKNRNFHPTVKSTKLMSYLIKLITPPEGVVLDPFMGSGSTGVSAIKEGFSFIGIEQSEEYLQIAQKRVDHAETKSEDQVEDQSDE